MLAKTLAQQSLQKPYSVSFWVISHPGINIFPFYKEKNFGAGGGLGFTFFVCKHVNLYLNKTFESKQINLVGSKYEFFGK